MGKAKNIILKPISSRDAVRIVKKYHYSGKVVQNSSVHIGVFYHGKLEGALQFVSPLDKRKVLPLVEGTLWNEMMELNRMAFSDALPKNSESRAISICMKMFKKHSSHIKWILSFADGTQCGHGTIYQASGFLLTGIKKNTGIWALENGRIVNQTTYSKGVHILSGKSSGGSGGVRQMIAMGATKADGYQLRYIYLLHKNLNLTVPVLPYSEVEKAGACMYKGEKV